MDWKRIQCLSNASQHVPIYLQPFSSNSTQKFKNLASPGYAPGTIAVNVTRIEREFNACQTPSSMYPAIMLTLSYPLLIATSKMARQGQGLEAGGQGQELMVQGQRHNTDTLIPIIHHYVQDGWTWGSIICCTLLCDSYLNNMCNGWITWSDPTITHVIQYLLQSCTVT